MGSTLGDDGVGTDEEIYRLGVETVVGGYKVGVTTGDEGMIDDEITLGVGEGLAKT